MFCLIEEEALIEGLNLECVSLEVFEEFVEKYHKLKKPRKIKPLCKVRLAPLNATNESSKNLEVKATQVVENLSQSVEQISDVESAQL